MMRNNSPSVFFMLSHQPTGAVIARVNQAKGWREKGIGLLGARELAISEGLWLPGVSSVHTVGMRISLDLLFMDEFFLMERVMERVRPGRPLLWTPRAKHVVELAAGAISAAGIPLVRGEQWELLPCGGEHRK